MSAGTENPADYPDYLAKSYSVISRLLGSSMDFFTDPEVLGAALTPAPPEVLYPRWVRVKLPQLDRGSVWYPAHTQVLKDLERVVEEVEGKVARYRPLLQALAYAQRAGLGPRPFNPIHPQVPAELGADLLVAALQTGVLPPEHEVPSLKHFTDLHEYPPVVLSPGFDLPTYTVPVWEAHRLLAGISFGWDGVAALPPLEALDTGWVPGFGSVFATVISEKADLSPSGTGTKDVITATLGALHHD